MIAIIIIVCQAALAEEERSPGAAGGGGAAGGEEEMAVIGAPISSDADRRAAAEALQLGPAGLLRSHGDGLVDFGDLTGAPRDRHANVE